MEKKKSIFRKIVLGVSACLIALCAVIPFIPHNKIDAVFADSTYTSATFNSSNLILTRLGYTSSSAERDFSDLSEDWLPAVYFNFSFKIDYDSSIDKVNFYVKGQFNDKNYLYDSKGTNVKDTFVNIGYYDLYSWIPGVGQFNSSRIRSGDSYYWSPILFNFEYFDSTDNFYISPNASLLIRPSLVINKIIFGNYTDYDRMNFSSDSLFGTHLNGGQYNFVSLIDSKGFRFTYFIPLCTDSSENITNSPANYLTYREYYTSNAINLGDNLIYQQGFDDGYNNGLLDGDSQGYESGYDVGLTEGYGNGYNAGVNDSNQYTFYNLFGAVLDAPVRVFSDLFNFNLLGINLLGLITGLFTLAMIILIVKKVIGGK